MDPLMLTHDNRLYLHFKRFTDLETCDEVLEEVKAQNRDRNSCPHCESLQIVRNGKYRDRQRYKCKTCGRTFNDYTNTPLSGTHYPHKWVKFLECMLEGFSLRRSAIRVGVTHATLFYWRHKLSQVLLHIERKEKKLRIPDPSEQFTRCGYVNAKEYPLLFGVPAVKRELFLDWICHFDFIAEKYWWGYVAWFCFVHKKNDPKVDLDSMKEMLLTTCSIPIKQTQFSLAKAS
jgi:transposase-like protein